MIYRCFNIQWETDGHKVKLPKEMLITLEGYEDSNEGEIEDALREHLSDETGWLHNGFEYEKVTKKAKKKQE